MAMESPNESPKRGYPASNSNLTGYPARIILRPERNPRFTYNVPPSSPSFNFQEPAVGHPSIFPNALLQDHGRRHFRNSNTRATTNTNIPTTTSSHVKYKPCLIAAIIFFSMITVMAIPILLFCVFGPRSPTFSVERVSLYYPVFYDSPTGFASLLKITMKVNNPTSHIDIFYEGDNSIVASYSGIRLCSGVIPPFSLGPNDEISVHSSLTARGVVLPADAKHKLENDHKNRTVPLTLSVMGMVRFKMGSVTYKALLKVSCDLVMDNLITYAKIISSNCDSAAGFWFPAIGN